MRAALKFVQYNYKPEKIIVWGSSYSAALSLKLASEFDKEIHGVIAFSPGEYFSKFGKSKTYITQSAKNINVPAFITSAKMKKITGKIYMNLFHRKIKLSFYLKQKGIMDPGHYGNNLMIV